MARISKEQAVTLWGETFFNQCYADAMAIWGGGYDPIEAAHVLTIAVGRLLKDEPAERARESDKIMLERIYQRSRERMQELRGRLDEYPADGVREKIEQLDKIQDFLAVLL